MNIDDEEEDNKDSGFYCLGCDDIRLELDCIKEQQGCLLFLANILSGAGPWVYILPLIGKEGSLLGKDKDFF